MKRKIIHIQSDNTLLLLIQRLLRNLVLTTVLLCAGMVQAQVTVGGSVFGGGNKANVKGSCSVTIRQDNAEVAHDVYGGGALADVNVTVTGSGANTTYTHTEGTTTKVKITRGTIGGDVYGGGLGNADTAALVYGEVTVNIGKLTGALDEHGFAPSESVFGNATLNGSVYGCNNINGTPKDNVMVHIYKTAQIPGVNTVDDNGYAIAQVFGGGNHAHYEPATAGKKPTVHIWTCDNTIEYLYGGGNAADLGNSTISSTSDVIIDGGRIEWVFGGGNGFSETNNHSNPDEPYYNPGADIYGDARVTYHAGYITYFFGGSNEWGKITGSKTIDIRNDGTCATENHHIVELYGGNNKAPIEEHDVNNVANRLIMPCPTGDLCQIDYLFGGSRDADINGDVILNVYGGLYNYIFAGNNLGGTINGNVTLNLFGGTINEAAFGGNNEGGAINGKITVNMIADEVCDLTVHNIYGGGYNACYNPTTVGAYPEVNLIHGTVSKKAVTNGSTTTYTAGNVFGGGYGQTATVKSNPKVRVGYDATMLGYIPTDYPTTITENDWTATVQNIVFGGGDLAAVAGSTSVTLQKATSSVSSLFGGGNQASVGNATVDVIGGNASTGVYGGCNQSGTVGGEITPYAYTLDPNTGTYSNTAGTASIFDGTIEVNIKSDLGTSGNALVEGIYGGGKGSATRTTGNVTVTITEDDDENVPTIYSDVYGGSALGWVGDDNDLTKVDFQNGTLHGVIYGGGMGDNDNSAQVNGNVQVDVATGSVSGGIYGGCNVNGTVNGNIVVSVMGGTIGAQDAIANVHGGGYGYQTSTTGDVEVTINGASVAIYGDVYGGSALGHVNSGDDDETNVILMSGTIHGDLYGGGLGDNDNAATVYGAVQVTVNGGTVTGSVYGCNNANGAPQSTVNVDIYATDQPTSGYALGAVFGGGNRAAYTDTPVVKVHNCDNKIEYVYGGGNKASVAGTNVMVYGGNTIGYVFAGGNGEGMTDPDYVMVTGNAEANIYGGTIGKVFGGNNNNGVINGPTIKVYVNKEPEETGEDACDMIIGEVYGGGNLAAGKAGTIDIDCTGDIVAGASGHLAHPELIGSTLEGIGTVYGGANAADISTNIQLDINSGIINRVFGGNNNSGAISGTIQVNIDSTGACNPHWYVGEVYGGGDHAHYGGTPDVNIKNGTVYRNVYGGGNDITADTPSNPTYGVRGSDVEMTGGNVLGGVYGGCNLKGTVTEDSQVKVTGGIIGTRSQLNDSIVASVFGGGLGKDTRVKGDVTVTIDITSATSPIIYGDVYGGSALGEVNNDGSSKNTTVNIFGGTLETRETQGTSHEGLPVSIFTGGNVYGGGLGDRASLGTGHNDVAAKSYGKVFVNIGIGTLGPIGPDTATVTAIRGTATIRGNVYGCNNVNGSPQDNVIVNVFKTAHNEGTNGYALHDVFGGGNKADFRVDGKTATVNIYTCDNTIERTFSGGNAAATNSVRTMIQGGRIREVFGGGNGEVTPADVYGTVTLDIHGGEIGQSYAGSNQQGTITQGSEVHADDLGPCGGTEVDEFFCGGNFANYNGNINATITCSEGMTVNNLYGGCNQALVQNPGNITLTVYGGTYNNIYGGSKGRAVGDPLGEYSADVDGNITLNIFGGTVHDAIFGGSNVKGNVKGKIVVNVEDIPTGTCSLEISEADVYGGGNKANYNPNQPGTENYPQINIRNATVKNVFGGGLEAEVKGNPQVRIKKGSRVLGNVYGGGNMGEVIGNPRVIINGKDNTNNPTGL